MQLLKKRSVKHLEMDYRVKIARNLSNLDIFDQFTSH